MIIVPPLTCQESFPDIKTLKTGIGSKNNEKKYQEPGGTMGHLSVVSINDAKPSNYFCFCEGCGVMNVCTWLYALNGCF